MSSLTPGTEAHWLLLTAALSPDDRSRAAYPRWRSMIDLQTLDHDSVKLLPALSKRLDDPDDQLARQITMSLRFTWLRSQMLIGQTVGPLRALADAGIPTMLMKGSAVLHHCGTNLELRPMADLDVAVPLERISAATAVLTECGQHPPEPIETMLLNRPELVTSVLHGMNFVDDLGASFDLHWHMVRQSLHPHADDAFWAAAEPATLRDVPTHVAKREDTLLHVITHAAGKSGASALQWAHDAKLLIGDGDIDWDRLRDQAREHDVAPMVREALLILRKLEAVAVPRTALSGMGRATIARPLERQLPDAARYARYGYEFGPVSARDVLVAERDRRRALYAAGALPQVPLDEDVEIVMGDAGEPSPHLIAGWHFSERAGTWSRDHQATLALRTGPVPGPLRLTLEFVPFLTPDMPAMRLDWRVDGRRVSSRQYRSGGMKIERLTVALEPKIDRDRIAVEVHVHDPRSPLDAGYNEDFRKLGVMLRSVRIARTDHAHSNLAPPR